VTLDISETALRLVLTSLPERSLMFLRLSQTFAITATLVLATPLAAQDTDAEKAAVLFDALEVPRLLDIMRLEGLDYGVDVGRDLFGGEPGRDWDETVGRIYDIDRMNARVVADLTMALEGDNIDAMIAFFEGEPGQSIISLEVSAREALLDDTVEEASKEAAAIAIADGDPRMDLIMTYVEVNDLIETNVVGALNSNYAFYTGLMEGGDFPQSLSEDEILADVWSQEPDIRQSTTEWVASFLFMAYQPLSDADLEAYIAFSETDAGKQVNEALFAAFDGLFIDISRDLGRASSRFMLRQEL